MVTYTIKTLSPFIGEKNINVNFQTEFVNYFETTIKNGLKQLVLHRHLARNKKELNKYVEQTLDLFLFSPSIFLEKEDSLKFYIKCSLELEKKELSNEFQMIDNLKMYFHFPKEKNLFENILLVNNQEVTKTIAIKSNFCFLCTTNSAINLDKYSMIVKNILKNEENYFNKKYKFFLLNSHKRLCIQDFFKNFNNVNFLITNEIYSFIYNLNYNNLKKLNKLLLNSNLKTIEKTLNIGIKENGIITPLNFFEIKTN